MTIVAPAPNTRGQSSWAGDITDVVNMFTDDYGANTDGDLTVNGDLVVAGIGGETFKYKTANETVNNSTTYQDDDHLFAPVVANGVYKGRIHLVYSATNTIDFKTRLTFPSGTITWSKFVPELATNLTDTEGDVGFVGAANVASPASDITFGTHNSGGGLALVVGGYIDFTLFISGTGGSLVFAWAQNTLVATDLVLYKGSSLELKRVA
jgi:hypothetical protein